MAAPSSTAIVPQILDGKHDYKDWSVHVKTYLRSKDLWDVVEGELPEQEGDFKVWRKNNAEALHAIQLSCGPRTFPSIRDKTIAKAAWDTLEKKFNREESSADEVPYEYQAFFTAVKRGEWDKTEEFLTLHPNATTKMNSHGTALHNAVRFEQEQITEKLVELMSEEDLEIQRARDGFTALHIAAPHNLKMVKCMVTKNKKLLGIAADNGTIPILWAAALDRWDIVRYLYAFTPQEDLTPDKGPCGSALLGYCLYAKQFDMALDLLQNCPRLAYTQNVQPSPISAFARLPSAFPSGVSLKFWQRWIYNWIHVERARSTIDFRINVQNQENEQGHQKNSTDLGLLQGLPSRLLDLLGITRIRELKLIHDQSCQILNLMCDEIKQLNYEEMRKYDLNTALFQAVESGISELVMSLCKVDPEMLYEKNKSGTNIFQYAVECRQEKVYSLVYGVGQRNFITVLPDNSNNNILHCAGMLSPLALAKLNRIPGAALQMQRERQWYKEVERVFFQLSITALDKNEDDLTPSELCTKNHEKLHKEGEEWMKGTASSCTVVSALVITIMFAAAFTVPGGNNQETGFPIFLNQKLFMLFIVSDAISLFSSATSVLMFLVILTARYAEDDFLKSLPTKMIIGLSTLFISIATMMVAFSSALFIMLQDKPWIAYPIICLAGVPVILYVWMQFPLLVDIFVSTYGGGIFDRKVKRWI